MKKIFLIICVILNFKKRYTFNKNHNVLWRFFLSYDICINLFGLFLKLQIYVCMIFFGLFLKLQILSNSENFFYKRFAII